MVLGSPVPGKRQAGALEGTCGPLRDVRANIPLQPELAVLSSGESWLTPFRGNAARSAIIWIRSQRQSNLGTAAPGTPLRGARGVLPSLAVTRPSAAGGPRSAVWRQASMTVWRAYAGPCSWKNQANGTTTTTAGMTISRNATIRPRLIDPAARS